MKNKLIAVLGLGYWGTIVTKTLVSLKIFNKIYIYDVDYKKVNILKKKFKNKVTYIKFNQILKNKNINNIFLATPPRNNYQLLNRLIDAKKNILIEKPGLISLNHYKNND